jgi:hypothetical protein
MPTQFTIYIPSNLHTDSLTNDISEQLSSRLVLAKYSDNFPISVNVQAWDQGN